MKKFTLFLSAMLISLMSFAQTVPTQEELWASFQTAAGLNLGTLDNLTAPALNTISGNLNADNLNKVFAEQEWQWLKTYVKTTQDAQVGGSFVDGNGTTRTVQALVDEITDGTNVINWRYAVAAFFVQSQYVGYPAASADFTEAGKPEAWGPAYLAAQESTTPELTTVTLTYELTKDAVNNRMGRQTISTEDAEFGSIQLVIPGFSADVAEYAEASLAVGDSTYAATATFAADAENNKEVYTAHAVSADTIFDATFTILIPATQEYTLTTVDAVAVPETEDGLTMYALEGEFVVEDALIPYELYVDPGFLSVMGTIGEAFVLGEGAEKVTFEIDEEEFYLKATLADDAGNTYNVEMIGVVEGGGEPIVELVLTDTVDVTLYNLTLEPQGPMATVNAGDEVLLFWLTLLPTENYYGFYFSDSFSNIWYGDAQLQPYGDGQYTPDGLIVAFTSTPDAEGKATLYNFTLIAGDEPAAEQPEPTYTENKLNTYAFGLESELNDTALVVTYRLNNSNATSVNVLVYKGEEVVATVAGTTTIGVNTVAIPVATLPQGRMLTWSVEVNGTSVEAPTQEEKVHSFYHPSGVDIDNNPENPTFGMLLVNEGMQKVKGVDGYVSTGFGAGIFAFTPSLDLIPNGDLPGYNGGVEFNTYLPEEYKTSDGGRYTAYSPRRVRISDDGRIFVTSLDVNGTYLWELNPENLNEWTPVFQGTLTDNKELITADSNFVAAPNNGFDVKGAGENLQLMMYSVNVQGITSAAMGGFRCDEYNLGTATSWATAPSKNWVLGKYAINYLGTQVVYDNEGGIWIASYRGAANDANPGLVHINADGVEDAKLVWSNVRQAGIRFNNDFTKLVVAGNNGAAKKATIYAVSKDANGAPVLTEETVIDMAVLGNNLNDFVFDYAGNLYAVSNSNEKLVAWAMPYSGVVETPAASKYAFHIGELLPDPVVVTEMVGVVKRAVQNGDAVIVLTHEADGTAHIYEVANGTILELLQNGVIARDPENAGDLLAISDIALTEDGKLVATNYMITQSGDDQVADGDKRGETRVYIWNDLHGAPSVLFTSKMSSNWFQSKQGLTMAVKGTSDNMEIFMTGIHKSKAWARVSSYRVINGVYEEPAVNHNDHYFFYDVADAVALETTVGTQYELTASPLGAMNWILDAELINPVEIVEPETNNVEISSCVALSTDLGKKYNGASYVAVGEQVLMVAPYADAEGKLAGVKVLDITAGLDAATEVATADLDAAVEATAAATAVAVAENTLTITLVADATLHTLEVVLESEPDYRTIEDNITNLEIDLDNMTIDGGPSTMWQVEVSLGLAEDDNMDGQWSLSPESKVAIMGFDARLIDGYVYDVDINSPAAKAVLYVEDSGFFYEIKLNMTSTPKETVVIVVEDALVEVEEWKDFPEAPTSNYALTMTADWTNEADGLTYPVKVEVLIYDPNVTEQPDAICNVVVGDLINDPWLGGVDGCYLTITTVEGVVTAKGVVTASNGGVALDLTISGKLPSTALDNIQVGNETVKVIRDGQLIIIKNDVEYNIQGAVVK